MDTTKLTYTVTDGGRAERGYRGETDDCVVKSIALALQKPDEDGIPLREVEVEARQQLVVIRG